MADSTTNITQIAASQAQKEVTANGLFDAASPALFGGRNAVTSSGLTWGYYGGRWGGTSVANGTLSIGASTTTYVVCNRSTGAISAATGTTAWNDTEAYARLYKLVSGGSTITSYEDHRAGPGGTGGGGTGAAVEAADVTIADAGTHYTATDVEGALQEAADRLDAVEAGVAAVVVPLVLVIACSDETTALTTGTNKVTFRMPYAMTLQDVRAGLTTAQASGSILTIDINEGGSSILSTKLTIDNGEKTSTTAATAAVISDTTLADDAEITIDIDQVGDGSAKGLKVTLKGIAP